MAKLAPAPELTAPEIAERLAANPAFAAAWSGFAPSHHREWSRFVAEAKKAETRSRRADQVVEQVQLKAAAAAEPSEAAAAV
jgi:uncharacterized protein YdeI (YjbR/CyaY-like superfamily)